MPTFVNHRGHTICPDSLGTAPLVLDLGANRGVFSDEMSKTYGARCVLVEANPRLAAALSGRVLSCAVAAIPGVVSFHIARNDEGSSLLTLPAESAYGCVLQETVDVHARTLDDLLTQVPAPDLLKMDIEGAETDVLLNVSEKALRAIGQIAVEFHCEDLFGFGGRDDVERVVRRLASLGFLAVDFSYPTRMDVLFLNRSRHRVTQLDRLRAEWPGRRGQFARRMPRLAQLARRLMRRPDRYSSCRSESEPRS